MADEYAALRKRLRKQGFELERTANQHWHVLKDGRRVAFMPNKMGEFRGLKNTIAMLKRAGYKEPGEE